LGEGVAAGDGVCGCGVLVDDEFIRRDVFAVVLQTENYSDGCGRLSIANSDTEDGSAYGCYGKRLGSDSNTESETA
jgi:hypothetical protein